MRRFVGILVVLTLLAGCASKERRELLLYMKSVEPFQQSLSDLKKDMARVQFLPVGERSAAYLAVADKVAARHADLDKLSAPPGAATLQKNMTELFTVFEAYLRQAAVSPGPSDPKLQELAGRWQSTMSATEAELNRLGAQ